MQTQQRRDQTRTQFGLPQRSVLERRGPQSRRLDSSIPWSVSQNGHQSAEANLRQLEAENMDLRGRAVELALEIQDLKARISK